MENNCPHSDLNMKRLKVEFCDENGEQVTVAVSGQHARERLIQIIGLFEGNDASIKLKNNEVTLTSMQKIIEVIRTKTNDVWFTSKDVSLLYSDIYHETIKPSTISTYLTRLYLNGYLERKGNRSCWQYHLLVNYSPNDIGNMVKDLQKK
jgi:hypothetical protein